MIKTYSKLSLLENLIITIENFKEDLNFFKYLLKFLHNKENEFQKFVFSEFELKTESKEFQSSKETLRETMYDFLEMRQNNNLDEESLEKLAKKHFSELDHEKSKYFMKVFGALHSPYRYNRYICHFITIQINTLLEYFICKYYEQLFLKKPEIFSNLKEDISFKELFSYENTDSLIEKITNVEIEKLSYRSIEKIRARLNELKVIDLKKVPLYDEIVEFTNDRHILVHLFESEKNTVKFSKTYYKIDNEYVNNRINDTELFISEMHLKVVKKFKIKPGK